METFTRLFGSLLLFAYHCFDRVVIHGYLSGLSRPGQVAYFFHNVIGEPLISKEVLSRRTNQYQGWVEAFARNHAIAIEWAEPKVRKEDCVRPAVRRMEQAHQHGAHFILKSMDHSQTFRSTVPRFAINDLSEPLREQVIRQIRKRRRWHKEEVFRGAARRVELASAWGQLLSAASKIHPPAAITRTRPPMAFGVLACPSPIVWRYAGKSPH